MVIFYHQLSPHGVILKFRGFPDLSSTPWGNDLNLVNYPMELYSNLHSCPLVIFHTFLGEFIYHFERSFTAVFLIKKSGHLKEK
jgi:hypothetical protein